MRLRIFIIDDDRDACEPLRRYIEGLGHEVLVAEEPMSCSIYHGECCQSDRACGDLIMVDQCMPQMTGLEFVELQRLRGCKGAPGNKIVLAGNINSVDLKRAERLGCQVLQKPLSFDEVDDILSAAVIRIDPSRKLADLSTM